MALDVTVVGTTLDAQGNVKVNQQRQESTGTLGALNAELLLQVNNDRNALLYIQNGSSFIGTLEFTGVSDTGGTQYFPIAAYPYSIGCVGGTIPLAGQPMLIDALVAANTVRIYAIPCGQLKTVRVRVSAYTSGSCVATLGADATDSINTAITARPTTLLVTATGAASAAVTATLPAVTGLRHIIDFIQVTRSATAALTASATPVVVTTTNMQGSPALTFGSDVAGIGIDKDVRLDFGSTGNAATVLGTATTVVCPVYTGVIWRVTVGYRLGL